MPAAATCFLVMSSMMLADVIGFLAVIVPGGLGVREGVMYLMLAGISIPAIIIDSTYRDPNCEYAC